MAGLELAAPIYQHIWLKFDKEETKRFMNSLQMEKAICFISADVHFLFDRLTEKGR